MPHDVIVLAAAKSDPIAMVEEDGKRTRAAPYLGLERAADSMHIRPKNALQEYILFYAVSAVALSVAFAIATLPEAFSLYNHSRLVDAMVTGKNCPNHAAVNVAYQMDGASYATLGELGDRCESARIGSHIGLWIDVTNPSRVFEDPPAAHLKDALEGVPIGALWMSLAVALVCMRVRRSKTPSR